MNTKKIASLSSGANRARKQEKITIIAELRQKYPIDEFLKLSGINFNIKSATFYQINMHNNCKCFTEDEWYE